jgi:membrane protein
VADRRAREANRNKAEQADPDREFPDAPRADYSPKGAGTDPGLFATLKRALKEFSEDNMTDWAAALTYYGVLSVFPALIAMVSLVGLFADPAQTTKTITDMVTQLGPKSAADTFAGPIKSVTSDRGASGVLLIVGIAGAIWSASGYIGAFSRAANVVWETPEGRPFWKLKPIQLLVTVAMILLSLVVVLSLILTGPVVSAVAGPLGIGSTAQTVWNIAKWPVLLVIVAFMFAVLFHAAPNVKMPGFRWISLGAAVAVVIWILASALFAFYVANFSSYNKTYGALGGVIIGLVWLWLTNCSLLLGMELNAERERSAELKAGVPRADEEIQLEPRDAPKRPQTT